LALLSDTPTNLKNFLLRVFLRIHIAFHQRLRSWKLWQNLFARIRRKI